MKFATLRTKDIFVQLVVLLHILLFTYAAVSKFLDFENFRIQLGQSPLLTEFASYVAFGVPIIEITIVIMLTWPQWRLTGLFYSFVLMVMFTAYIFTILNFSDRVPCSCGGILEKLGWQEHLVFNLIFVMLELLAITFYEPPQAHWLHRMKPGPFIGTIIGSSAVVVAIVANLFFISEVRTQGTNDFIRRFPTKSEAESRKVDLKFNSYNFAGIYGDRIYLTNKTAHLSIAVVDTSLNWIANHTITLETENLPFISPQVAVAPPYFYLYDGTVPCIFKGKVNDWIARLYEGNIHHSTAMTTMDTLGFVMRSTSLKTKSNTLYTFEWKSADSSTSGFVLPAQVDGIFDTDGILIYNSQLDKIHYVFNYRNQYLTLKRDFSDIRAGKTIDTVSKVKIKVVNTSKGETRMSAPPLTINKNAATYKNLLFIQSNRIGKFEDDEILDYATIIDVYDTTSDKYISSLYVYNIGKSTLRNFKVYDNKLYALSGRYLSIIKLNANIRAALR